MSRTGAPPPETGWSHVPTIPIPTASGTCGVTPGTGTATLIRGSIVAPEGLLENGHLLLGGDGKIACADCDCSGEAGFSEATVVACPNGVVAPGLINAHEHVTFGEGRPIPTGDTRYDHRHEWRTGARGAVELNTPRGSSGEDPVLYAELRHLVAGATSVAGSGGAPGLLRNLDRGGALQEGLDQPSARYSTFPLGDARGTLNESGCNYGDIDAPTDGNIAGAIAYLPHVAEGIDASARNEFLCLSRAENGGQDVLLDKTAFIHGTGMTAIDYAVAAADGASLVWSPRTNVSLYGVTAPFPMARRLGVNIALGTDWPASGSQNMLRELACAAELDDRNYGDAFTDRQLVDMATQNAAAALKSDGRIGRLAAGLEADVAIFDGSVRSGYRAIIEGEPAAVALVLRGGTPLYGDAEPMAALRSSGCEPLDVCGTPKQVCVQGDSGKTLAQVRGAVSSGTIELFSCGVPSDEPTCVPFRSGEFLGIPSDGDQDGDGIMDMLDNCPTVFNPTLPLDPPMTQANADGDMDGDLCDVCPLDADSTTCTPPNPEDRDADMVPNGMDNCPDVPNPDQLDADRDSIGDLCDRCPDFANPGNSACPANIYGIKQGNDTGEVLVKNAMVTAVGVNGYNLQILPGDPSYDDTLGVDFSGIFVFDRNSPRPAVGDRVDVEGSVNIFFGQTQIAASGLTVVSSGNAAPAPVRVEPADIATGGSRAEALEGVLVEVQNVTVIDAAPDEGQFFEFVVTDNLRIDDFYYLADPFPMLGQSLGFIRGPLRFANDDFKVVPRDAGDLDQAPVLIGLELASSFALEMSGPISINLRLNRAADRDLAVAVSASGPVVVPSTVTVPMGASEVALSATPGAASATPAQVTATLGTSMVSASVRVYSDAEPRSVTAVRLDQPGVMPAGTVEGTVELDLPGAAGGTPVTLTFAPALASAPGLTVPAGATTAPFTVTAGPAQGITTLTAAAAGGQAQTSLHVSSVTMAAPSSPGDVFISEIMKNPAVLSDDAGEWFEIYNPSANVIYELQGCTISDADGDSFSVASSLTVAPGAYATLAKSSMPGFTAGYDWGGSSNMNLANGDDEVIVSCGGTEIDRVDYTDAAFPDVTGASMQLSLPVLQGMSPHVANDTGASFCAGSAAYNGTDQGTPGAANGPC